MKHEKNPNQKAFRINNKTAPAAKPVAAVEPAPEVDTAKAVAFAMSIAREMKQRQRDVDAAREEEATIVYKTNDKKYSRRDLDVFRRVLEEQRVGLCSNSTTLKEAVGLNDTDDIEPDGGDGTTQSMRLSALSQVEKANKTINDIDEALRRVEDGSYGICLSCGSLIDRNRLLHSPFVKTCTTCQETLEATARRNAE